MNATYAILGIIAFAGMIAFIYAALTAPEGIETPQGLCLFRIEDAEQEDAQLSGAGSSDAFFHAPTNIPGAQHNHD